MAAGRGGALDVGVCVVSLSGCGKGCGERCIDCLAIARLRLLSAYIVSCVCFLGHLDVF